MGIFAEWLEQKQNEVYGFGSQEDENLDQELYGIRETLKNALSGGTLAYNWGDLGERIRRLTQIGVDQKLVQQAHNLYQQMLNPINQGYQQARDSGAREAKFSDPKARQFVHHALKAAWEYFEPIQKVLTQMGSHSGRAYGLG